MIFTSYIYIYFFLIVGSLYWLIRRKELQNIILLVSSYLFYGWITPWFCLLIATSTIVDYFCARGMKQFPHWKKAILGVSLFINLGMLAVFKYFNFFLDNFLVVFNQLGMSPNLPVLQIVLPVGISFYTFQTLSYTIDIYRGKLSPRTNFVDFALFVSFFPQLVAGPIERAINFLPQIEKSRVWSWQQFERGVILIIQGYFKKLVIADNIAFYVDKIYMLDSPGLLMLSIGTFAFSLQIYADFSGYTDIARGSAKLLGFELMRNFNFPYFAVSPSDFWRRWHISLSSWIRDYIYIPLGGSRHKTVIGYVATVFTTMFLCGLWHGAAWNYVVWGVFHGGLLVAYALAGLTGKWRPNNKVTLIISWAVMYFFILIGWSIFRAPSMEWWLQVVWGISFSLEKTEVMTAVFVLLKILFYCGPLAILVLTSGTSDWRRVASSFTHACILVMIVVFHSESAQDFIYFQF